ncbi:MAG TPA: GNAT family N-acetyltransferase [Alphaproteobacteria bacterium]
MADTLAALAPIATARLRLSPLSGNDAPAVRDVTDHPEITRRIDFLASPFTLRDAEALVARNAGASERMLGIRRGEDDALIGVIGAHLHGEHEIEVGYWLGRDCHGRGYATEALCGLVDALRRCLPERRIVAECDPQNLASWRVLAKAGFQTTGQAGARPGRRLLALSGPPG